MADVHVVTVKSWHDLTYPIFERVTLSFLAAGSRELPYLSKELP